MNAARNANAVGAMLAAFVRGLVSAPREEARLNSLEQNAPREETRASSLSPEQIVALIDARLRMFVENEPAPSAPDLDAAFTQPWSQPPGSMEEARAAMAAAQSNHNGTYRPDQDYMPGEDGPATPWMGVPPR